MRLPPTMATRRVLACMSLLGLGYEGNPVPAGRPTKPIVGEITNCGLRVTPLVTVSGTPGASIVPGTPEPPRTPDGGTLAMSDRYQSLIHTPVGQLLAKNLGLPNPVELERYEEGQPLVKGTVVVGGSGRLGKTLTVALDELG